MDWRFSPELQIVAADVDDKKLQHAKTLGADVIVNNRNASEAAERIQPITGPRGAGLVLDCVGVQPTLDLGARLLGRNSVWTIVGLGGGHHDFTHGSTPYGTSMTIPYWGSSVGLMEVIAMARAGRIHAETTEFPLGEAVAVYDKLKAGQITGRAVLVPGLVPRYELQRQSEFVLESNGGVIVAFARAADITRRAKRKQLRRLLEHVIVSHRKQRFEPVDVVT